MGSCPGSAFLYARREVQRLLEPLVAIWGWESSLTPALSQGEREGPSRFVPDNEWQGTRDPAACLSVPAAIRFEAQHDWPRVRAECYEVLRDVRLCIEEIGRPAGRPYEPICPDSPEWYAQMAALPLPACDAGALQRRLYDEYRVEVPILSWGGRQFVRVSIQGYNTAEDMEALATALQALFACTA